MVGILPSWRGFVSTAVYSFYILAYSKSIHSYISLWTEHYNMFSKHPKWEPKVSEVRITSLYYNYINVYLDFNFLFWFYAVLFRRFQMYNFKY